MKRFAFQLYGLGMLTCGYAAGQFRGDRGDWTGWPWTVNLGIGLAMLLVAGCLYLRSSR